jgi:hypothetical protein
MLKIVATILISALVCQTGLMAQIYVKNTGNVGIGTNAPAEKLHLVGKMLIESSTGDQISLISNTTSPWVNMSFFRNGTRHGWLGLTPGNDFVINKDQPGNMFLNAKDGWVIIDRQNTDPAIGGSLALRNALKGNSVPGAPSARDWVLYNMSSNYGNGLQFWAYDNVGCGTPGGICNVMFTIMDNGNVGVGTNFPAYKLQVEGEAKATRYWADAGNHWPDYVFDSTYKLPSLNEVESYLKQNHHLPDVPSATEVQKTGLELSGNQALLLKKVEELTLYVIEQNKKQEAQNEKLALVEKKLNEVLEENSKLKENVKAAKQ